MVKTKSEKLHNASLFVKVATILAFIAVSGIVTVTAFQANKQVEDQVIAGANRLPKNWNASASLESVANTALSAKVINGKYVQYTASVENAAADEDLYITHLAAYLSSDGVQSDGFMSLDGNSLEYSFTPDNADSWRSLPLAAPDSKEAFRLTSEIRLGRAGDNNSNTVYFRFYASPEDSEVSTISNKFSCLLRTASGQTGYAASTNTVALSASASDPVVATVDSADSAVADTYTAPLGVSSFVPEIETVSKTVASISLDSQSFLTVGIIAMVVSILIFAICLAFYLPLKKY